MKQIVPIVIALALSGCLSAAEGSSSSTQFASSPSSSAPPLRASTSAAAAAPSEDQGSLTVTVTTTELVPVEAAQVIISDLDLSDFTDAAGAVTFNGLSPGAYTVLAAKPGYRSVQDKGRIGEVSAGEVTEVKLTLEPIQVIDAANSYHTTWPFTGFIACAMEAQPGAFLGRSTLCGHWLNPGGVMISDPNDKSLFKWTIENNQIQGIVLEGVWQPTTGLTGQQLRMTVHDSYVCSAVSCLSNGWDMKVEGPSPLWGQMVEGPEHRLTSEYGAEPENYPKEIWTETMSYCQTNCTGINLVFQQEFDKYLTAFYGAEPPAGFSVLPS